jgi:hypothetical protein
MLYLLLGTYIMLCFYFYSASRLTSSMYSNFYALCMFYFFTFVTSFTFLCSVSFQLVVLCVYATKYKWLSESQCKKSCLKMAWKWAETCRMIKIRIKEWKTINRGCARWSSTNFCDTRATGCRTIELIKIYTFLTKGNFMWNSVTQLSSKLVHVVTNLTFSRTPVGTPTVMI